MKSHIAKITAFGLVAAALTLTPTISRAQDASTNAPAQAAPKKHGVLLFHGKVTAVDTGAETLTVGKLTINITSTTKISKDNQAITLSDIAVGDTVRGAYKKDAAGNLNATTIRDGVKAGGKKKTDTGDGSSTNSVPPVPNPN
jgi:hypothetical protein